MMKPLVGSVEAGGTKIVCAVGTGPDDVRDEMRFPTAAPPETLGRAVDYFRRMAQKHGRVRALGIGSFGPVDLDEDSAGFGRITTTPKSEWSGVDVVAPFARALEIPVAFDTDVNAAAIGEHRWGAAQRLDTFVYLTVGTGIGGGGFAGGRPMRGLTHPEMGHMRIPRDVSVDPFAGVCPYHGDCWEGLASGRAIEERWGLPPEEIPPGHKAWSLEADCLACGVANLIFALSPQRVIIGGGVMHQNRLMGAVRKRVLDLLGGYADPALAKCIEDYIVPPALGDRAGILGGFAMALRKVQKEQRIIQYI